MEKISDIWATIQQDYVIERVIGVGSFGEVVRARQKTTQSVVAIKLLKHIFDSPYKARQLIAEIQIMRHLTQMGANHTIKIHDVIIHQEDPGDLNGFEFRNLFIVMECADTDLRKLLSKVPQAIKLSMSQVVHIFYNILCSMNFMHTAGIMHRDIKPANILLNEDCSVRVCDFGLSRTASVYREVVPSSKPIAKFESTPQKQPMAKKYLKSINSSPVRKSVQSSQKKFKSSKQSSDFQSDSQDLKTANSTTSSPFKSHNSRSQVSLAQEQAGSSQRDQIKGGAEPRKRHLSNHVISRWYRPPEIILIQKDYNSKVDMWSLGCLLSDMLAPLQPKLDPKLDVRQRCLFKGNSCFPLSPKYEKNKISSGDQLVKIMEILPQLYDNDTDFVLDSRAKKNIETVKIEQSEKLNEIYKDLAHGPHKHLFTVLQNLLQFNPHKRWSAKSCLKSPIFDGYRSNLEKDAPYKIKLPIFDDGAFNYETGQSDKYSLIDFQDILIDEILKIKNME